MNNTVQVNVDDAEKSQDVFRVGVRVPPFWPEKPAIWFAQIEGQFAISNITADTTKFYYVVSHLDPRYATEVEDIIVNPPATDKYVILKAELIKRLSESREKKVHQLLTHEELGDRKPSQFLRHLQHLAGPKVPEEFLRTIWSSRLPSNIQSIIASQASARLDVLADLADRIHDVVPRGHQVAATSTQGPDRLMSPYTAIIRRSANPFELAHVLVSWLNGGNYDSYVVVGCAKRDVCMAIRYRTVCPEVPDETVIGEEPPPPEEEPRYKLVPLPDLTSKYVFEMSIKEEETRQKEIDKILDERRKKIAELEQPPPDDIDGWRTHAWVLVLPPNNGVEEPFFIEPSEGNAYPLSAVQYQHIESVYNHENYYVNIQKVTETGVGDLNYDLADLACWEHLLPGEPFFRTQWVGIDTADPKTATDTEKHLDMPASWVEKLDITADDYEQRYPGSHKVIHYKKVLLEKFSPYSQRDGIIKRINIYQDYALNELLTTYEWYKQREDKMMTVNIDHVKRKIREIFGIGRRDHLLKHEYSMDAPSTTVEGDRVLEFNYYPRLDHLTKLVCTSVIFEEHYTDRADRLESRKIIYTPPTKLEPKRQVKDITETYSRDFNIPAKKDIWKKIFHIQDNTIDILYHYEYNFVTNNTRNFIKPNLAETGGKILFYPDKTSGYIADPVAERPRPLDVYYSLCENIEWEYKTSKHIRDRETDINSYLRQRYHELKEPELYVALYDTERNDAAKKGWADQEHKKAEVTEREKEAEIDPLAPYLARMFGSGHGTGAQVSVKEATLIREQCINDFKAKQLARQHIVQERFDKYNAEYKNKRLWYLANQFILTPEKEASYFVASAELSFKVHALEVRLTRHRDLSGPRFKVLMDYLDKHPLLKEYTRLVRHHHQRRQN